MTQAEVPNAQVDEQHMANAIGSLLSVMGTAGAASDPMAATAGPASGGGAIDQATATPITPTQTATTGDAMGTQQTGTQDANSNSSGTVDPVPKGTAVAQGWGGASGGHPGVDLSVPVGTTIVSAISGHVINASDSDPNGYGNMVEVAGPNGISTRYGHLSYIGVKVGDTVKAGQPIGKSGGIAGAPGSGNSTGPHLHFEVDQGGHTLDPMPYLAGGAQILGSPDASGFGEAGTKAATAAVSSQDAVDTAVKRMTGTLTGNDPGSENTAAPTTTSGTGQGVSTASMHGADNDPGALGAFLAATKQHESGGDYTARNNSGQSNAAGAYQFLGSTWKGAGGSTASAADASPQEQDAVASKMAMALFNEFHSWRLVAIAWYGGPGIAQQVAAGQDPGSPQGQGGYLAYGDTIANMMSGGK